MVAPRLELDELIEHFTLLPDEITLLGDRTGASRLGFALLLKFFTRAGRFPSGRSELADEVVEFVASQVGVLASELGFYDWSGRTIKRHRVEVRRVLGFRECSVEDAEKVTVWLTEQVAPSERRPELVRHALLGVLGVDAAGWRSGRSPSSGGALYPPRDRSCLFWARSGRGCGPQLLGVQVPACRAGCLSAIQALGFCVSEVVVISRVLGRGPRSRLDVICVIRCGADAVERFLRM